MGNLAAILAVSWLAGAAAFAGAALAHVDVTPESINKRELLHAVMSFGGGILVAAVAYALTPMGMRVLDPLTLGLCFAFGGIVFGRLDLHMRRHGGTRAQFIALVSDFIPEALSLGAVFGHDRRLGMLLAAFIGVQNLPEGFNAYRELVGSGTSARTALGTLLALSLLGPLAAAAGFYLLHDRPAVTAGVMAFAGGGILYLVFQDIAPHAAMRRHWMPTLGAVAGFAVGMLGTQALG